MELLDILTILSFIVSLQNLSLNEQQVRDLNKHLNDQDKVLEDEQNTMLNEIIAMLKKILSLLEGEQKNA